MFYGVEKIEKDRSKNRRYRENHKIFTYSLIILSNKTTFELVFKIFFYAKLPSIIWYQKAAGIISKLGYVFELK